MAVHRSVPRARRATVSPGCWRRSGPSTALMSRPPHPLSAGNASGWSSPGPLPRATGLLVLDEPTSALDVTVQERVWLLIERLRTERGLAYLLISHNLAVVDRLGESASSSTKVRPTGARDHDHTAAAALAPLHTCLRAAVTEIGVQRPALTRISAGVSDEDRPPGACTRAAAPGGSKRCRAESRNCAHWRDATSRCSSCRGVERADREPSGVATRCSARTGKLDILAEHTTNTPMRIRVRVTLQETA